MIEAFYEISSNNIDKSKTWYSIKNKILYVKGINYKYFLEVTQVNDGEKNYLVLLSNNIIHKSCKRCNFDNYGRLKLKLKHHINYIENIIDKDSNIKFDYVENGAENGVPYVVYKISVI